MHVVRVNRPGELTLAELPTPEPQAGDVLVKVRRAGVCGSDLHILHGKNPFATYPRIVGHEFMGVISALGDGVEGISVGTRVVIDPVVSCGSCHACRIGRPNVCKSLQVIGVHRDGGMAEYVSLPAKNVHVVPENISDRLAAMAEPYTIAANILGRTGVYQGEWAFIYGAGTMGLTAIQVAKMKGAKVIVAEPSANRREKAKMAGATLTLDPLNEDVLAVVAELTEGDGPSLVVDCAGIPQLLPQAIEMVASAGRIGLLSFSEDPVPLVQKELVRKELTLYASRLNRGLIPEVLGWFANGLVDGESLISHEFAYKDAAEAFRAAGEDLDSVSKVHLVFE